MKMLQTVVLVLGRLNECLACFNPWIVVPPRSPGGQTEWLHVICLSLSYATIEPLAVLALQASRIPPWVLTLCLGPLGATAAFVFVGAQDPESSEYLPSAKDKEESPRHRQRQQVRSAVALLPCVLASALNNAALLLFGQSLYASWIQERSYITYILGPWAIVVSLVCRYADYEIYKHTGRPIELQELRRSSVYGPAVAYLALIFGVRMVLRMAVGVEPFLGFHPLGFDQADMMYPEAI
jgi:hypothetical protein